MQIDNGMRKLPSRDLVYVMNPVRLIAFMAVL